MTGCTDVMATVMVSLPEELLVALEAAAARKRTTRSGLLRDYINEGLRHRAQQRARRVQQIPVGQHGGRGVDNLKHDRPQA